ncbi:hypothetical protein HI914_03229 [Erysiphe necator]|nr:hypothetical protein HI914_03229 [Erysiphe necator]
MTSFIIPIVLPRREVKHNIKINIVTDDFKDHVETDDSKLKDIIEFSDNKQSSEIHRRFLEIAK